MLQMAVYTSIMITITTTTIRPRYGEGKKHYWTLYHD